MFKNIFFAFGTIVLLAVTIAFLPLDRVNWGRISVLPAATITVTGTSQGNVVNNSASFSATVTATNSDKQTAIDAVNTKMTALIKSLKDFGIVDLDIKTQQVTVYQQPEVLPMRGNGSSQTGNLVWYASNSIGVTVRDVNKASQVSDILNKSGATNVYGPNLTSDNTSESETDLLSKAVADARKKAESIAKAGGQSIGRMISVSENGSNYPVPLYAKAAETSTTPIQPGTTTLSKNVTVVFELK